MVQTKDSKFSSDHWLSRPPTWTTVTSKVSESVQIHCPEQSTTNETDIEIRYSAWTNGSPIKTSSAGGCGGADVPLESPLNGIRFQYQVFFPEKFDFVKSGKLPGLWGGLSTNREESESCSGGIKSTGCFSYRLVWLPNGTTGMYYYASEESMNSTCAVYSTDPDTTGCDKNWGLVLGREKLQLNRGAWNDIEVGMKVTNDASSILSLTINNDSIVYDKVQVQLPSQNHQIQRIMFSSFFGGSTPDYWTPKNQTANFRNFRYFPTY